MERGPSYEYLPSRPIFLPQTSIIPRVPIMYIGTRGALCYPNAGSSWRIRNRIPISDRELLLIRGIE